MTIIVDMDGVICTEEKTFERPLAKVRRGAREGMRALRKQGHTIIIYTARSWSEFRVTAEWLKRHGIVYDALLMGKPVYDVWLDDRAMQFTDWNKSVKALAALHQKRRRK